MRSLRQVKCPIGPRGKQTSDGLKCAVRVIGVWMFSFSNPIRLEFIETEAFHQLDPGSPIPCVDRRQVDAIKPIGLDQAVRTHTGKTSRTTHLGRTGKTVFPDNVSCQTGAARLKSRIHPLLVRAKPVADAVDIRISSG